MRVGETRKIVELPDSISFSRHANPARYSGPDNPLSKKYPSITEKGVKQLSYAFEDRWTTDCNKPSYFAELLKKYGGDHRATIHDWIETQGKLVLEDESTITGPLPEKVAREYLEGIMRVYHFVKKQFPNRPIRIHGVGHQLDLDAVVTFLATRKVDTLSFIQVTGGTAINESELIADITFSSKGQEGAMEERGQWETRTSFILAAIGSAIGLGNIWRFPYICANNGGGAFLIAFVVALITAGIPILIMELSIGHKLGLVLTWVTIVGCIWKGPETVGKVVYATVLIPWIYCSARVVRAADYRDCRQV